MRREVETPCQKPAQLVTSIAYAAGLVTAMALGAGLSQRRSQHVQEDTHTQTAQSQEATPQTKPARKTETRSAGANSLTTITGNGTTNAVTNYQDTTTVVYSTGTHHVTESSYPLWVELSTCLDHVTYRLQLTVQDHPTCQETP